MEVISVPVLQDNYAYLLVDTASKTAAAIDPAEPRKVLSAAIERELNITTILTTHHHWDHADGNPEMVQLLNERGTAHVDVIGGDTRIPALSRKVGDDDVLQVGALNVRVIFSPCHTTGHVMYFVQGPDATAPPVLFSGDTLFLAGCGRFFEGTAEQMYQAICVRARQLPPETLLYCGHEYSVANLQFAHRVDPTNPAVANKLAWAIAQREQKLSTIPSTLAEEASYNPFMRVDTDAIKAAVALPTSASSIETMQALRELKNRG